ncbi:hypothetical protein CRYUN_Cryun31cG0105500 [Craigia yunnanensis]
MDTNNWGSTPPNGEPTMETGDWRTQLQPLSRQRIVNKIMDTLKRHLPFSGLEGLNELRKIAVRFEEKIFTAASSQPDYLRRISLKMLTMEAKSQNTIPNTGNNSNPPDLGSQGMQNQVPSQGQSIPIPLQSNQSQACQQLLPHNVPNNMATAGVQSSTGLQSGMPSVSGLTQNPMPNVVGQNSNMQSMSGISQNSLEQRMPSNFFANQQRQMQGRQQMLLQQQQQQQQRQQQQHLYHQQLQHQLMKQKIQQGNLKPSLMQPHMQQQQQQNLLPPTQLQSSQHSASLDSTAQTGHANGGDWQEEVYQKIKAMKETYLPELNEMYLKIAAKLQQHDSLPQQPKSEQLEKLKIFKTMLERIITFLSVSEANISPTFKDKLSSYEKQIINFINTNRPRKSVSALQQGEIPTPHTFSMQQPQSQSNQTQSHDSQMNPQLQSINLQGSVPTMQSNNMTSLQHNSLSSLPGVSTTQQTMLNSQQPGSNLDSDEHSKPSAQFLTSSTPLFQAPFVPSISTLLTPSPTPGYSEKPIYGPSSLSNYRNISHQQATGFENGNDTHGNALITDFGKSNVEEQRHDPRVIMAKPMSLKSLCASVVTMVDEAGAAVGEDLVGMRKRGLHARNFFAQIGMTGADKMRCYMSAIVIFVLLFWCIFILHHQN